MTRRLRLDFDFDLARLGGFLFGKGDAQDAIFEAGNNVLGIESVGHGEAADEAAIAALDAVIALAGLLLLELALAGDGEGLVLDADVDVFGIDIRDVGFEDELVLGLVDVDGGRPGAGSPGLIDHTGESVFEKANASQGIEMGERHNLQTPHSKFSEAVGDLIQ